MNLVDEQINNLDLLIAWYLEPPLAPKKPLLIRQCGNEVMSTINGVKYFIKVNVGSDTPYMALGHYHSRTLFHQPRVVMYNDITQAWFLQEP